MMVWGPSSGVQLGEGSGVGSGGSAMDELVGRVLRGRGGLASGLAERRRGRTDAAGVRRKPGTLEPGRDGACGRASL